MIIPAMDIFVITCVISLALAWVIIFIVVGIYSAVTVWREDHG